MSKDLPVHSAGQDCILNGIDSVRSSNNRHYRILRNHAAYQKKQEKLIFFRHEVIQRPGPRTYFLPPEREYEAP